jgi:hypothetical protein
MDLANGKYVGATQQWWPLSALATLAVIMAFAMVLGFVAVAQRGPGIASDAEFRISSSIAAPPGSAAANSPRSSRTAQGE